MNAPQLKLFECWSADKALPRSDRGLAAKERDVLAAYEASLPPLAVPAPDAPKKPTEAEFRAKIASGEREVRALKEQVQHAQTLLGQREKQAAFVEAEFTALREAHAARESAAEGMATGLKQLLLEREAWLHEKDNRVEAERTRLTEDVSRLAIKLEAASAASAASESRLAEEIRHAVASRQELETKQRDDANNAAAREMKLSAEIESLRAERDASRAAMDVARKSDGDRQQALKSEVDAAKSALAAAEQARMAGGDREQALQSEIDAVKSALAAAEDARDTLQVQAFEQGRELMQLTRLYLDASRAEAHLLARVEAVRAETDASHRDRAVLIERHALESKAQQTRVAAIRAEADASRRDRAALSDRLAKSEHGLKARQGEVALLRDVNALYDAELACMDQRLAEIQASTGRILSAPVRHLRAWLGGRREGAQADVGSSVELLRRSRWFDADWYTSQYRDVLASGLAPEAHYLARGAVEARDPSPEFDTQHYLASNPDVADSGQNPLLHFIRHGEAEGRSPSPERGA